MKTKAIKLSTIVSHNPDLKSFQNLYDQYWSKLFYYALNILDDHALCEDIVQEVFVDIWRRRDSIFVDNWPAYLFRATKFQVIRQLRNGKIREKHIAQINTLLDQPTPEEIINLKELKSTIDNLVDDLPEKCREIFILSRYEHLAHKDIASKLGISVQTVKNQISNALNKLNKGISSDIAIVLILFASL